MLVHDWSKVEAGVFHDFHHEFTSAVKHALNTGVLPADYYAMADQVVGPGHPDVIGLRRATQRPKPRDPDGATRAGGTAVAVAPAARFEETSDRTPKPRRRKQVAIRHVSGDRWWRSSRSSRRPTRTGRRPHATSPGRWRSTSRPGFTSSSWICSAPVRRPRTAYTR